MFTLTPAAVEQINRAATAQPAGNRPPMLRVAAKVDAKDGELVYGMGFDEEREDDLIVDADGVLVLISPLSQPLLEHATLDFSEVQRGEFQFIFRGARAAPPGATGCGGCGGACSLWRKPKAA